MPLHHAARTSLSAALCTFALATAALTPIVSSAQAAPPAQQKTQVPGYYRMMIGGLEVTALYDGYIGLDAKLLQNASAKDVQTLLARMFVSARPAMQTAVNAYLINTGSQLILVDTGAAACFGPTLGGIVGNLRAAGYAPEQVNTVLLTHLHGDHACGLTANGKAVFTHATVHADKTDADYWLSESVAAAAPKDAQSFFAMARDAVAPYRAAGRFRTFDGRVGESPIAGVRAMPEPGHTPGHTGYLFISGKDSLLLWGDIVHSHATQFRRPEISIEFDVDSKQAIATRKRVLADAASGGLWVGGAHLPFPGLGHVRHDPDGYAWVPAEFSPLPMQGDL